MRYYFVQPRQGGKLYATCVVNLMLGWAGLIGPIAPEQIRALYRLVETCENDVYEWQRRAMVDSLLYDVRIPAQAQRVYDAAWHASPVA